MRTLLTRQDWESTGLLSAAPNDSSVEAKAARMHEICRIAVDGRIKPTS